MAEEAGHSQGEASREDQRSGSLTETGYFFERHTEQVGTEICVY